MTISRNFLRHVSSPFFTLLVAYCILSSGIVPTYGQSDAQPRIRHGNEAPKGRFEYMGSLQDKFGFHQCAAVLIEPEWLLTAAHCVYPNFQDALVKFPIVVLGDHDVNDKDDDAGIEKTRVEETFIHPSYDDRDIDNGFDIALIKLPGPSKKTPIPWARTLTDMSTQVGLTIGWGDEGKRILGEGPLKMADVPIMRFDICKNNFWKRLKSSMICGDSRLSGTCEGDSGGPLIFAHEPEFDVKNGQPGLDLLIGIVSFGTRDCSTGRKPDVYTKVSSFAAWIDKVIGGGDGESANVPAVPQPTGLISTQGSSFDELKSKYEGQPLKNLEKALCDAAKQNNPLLLDVVLELGVDTSTTCGSKQMTALHLASREGSVDAVKELIKNGANVDAKDKDGATPLHFASNLGFLDIVMELIASGADVNAKDRDGLIPLHDASDYGHVDIVKELIASGADVNAKDKDGWTPLHGAVYESDLKLTQELLKLGADVNVQKRDGETPLHLASASAFINIVEVLLANGADKQIKNNFNERPRNIIGLDTRFVSSKDRAKLKALLA